MNHHLRPSIWFSIILVAAFIVGYLAWVQANSAWPYDNVYIPYPERKSPSTRDTLSGVEGWQTYRNEEFGFEVKYSPNRMVNKRVTTVEFNSQSESDMPFSIIFETATYINEEYFKKISNDPLYIDFTTNSGIKAKKAGGVVKIFKQPNILFTIVRSSPFRFSETEPEFELFVKSFKFVEPTSKSDWKIYRNTKYSYSIKYPPTFTIFVGTNQQKQEIIPPAPDSQKVSLTNNKEFLFCCEALITSLQVINGPIDTKNWKQYANIPDYRIKSQGEITFAERKAFEVRASAGIDSAGARLILISGNPFSYVIIQGDEGEPWGKITNSFRLE